MKKRIMLFAGILCILMLTACGGLQNLNEIKAADYISKEEFEVKVAVTNGEYNGSRTEFALDQTISQVEALIKNKDNTGKSVNTQVYKDKFILISYTNEGSEGTNYFLLQQIDKIADKDGENDNRYVLFAPIVTFKGFGDIYIPYHLLNTDKIQYYSGDEIVAFEAMEKFETTTDMEEFLAFYEGIGSYTAEKDGKDIVVKEDGKNKFRLNFTNENGTAYVSFIMITE